MDYLLCDIVADALQTHNYKEAIARLKEAGKAGADVAFFEGLTSKEQAASIIKHLAPDARPA